MLPTFSQDLARQEAFEIAARINEELKWTESDGAFGKNFKLLIDMFVIFFC